MVFGPDAPRGAEFYALEALSVSKTGVCLRVSPGPTLNEVGDRTRTSLSRVGRLAPPNSEAIPERRDNAILRACSWIAGKALNQFRASLGP